MKIHWNSGRFINIYEIETNPSNHDKLIKELRKNDPYIYDLRIESHRIELAYFFHINKKTMEMLGNNFFTSSIDFIQGAMSVDFAMFLIKEERYWEAHEVLENQWQASSGIKRITYQYIILLCAAGVHMQHGHADICRNIIERANKLKILDNLENIDIISIKIEKILNPYAELSDLIQSFRH